MRDHHAGIADYATPDIVCTIPGSSMVSGRATGADQVTSLADTFAQYRLNITPRGFAFGLPFFFTDTATRAPPESNETSSSTTFALAITPKSLGDNGVP